MNEQQKPNFNSIKNEKFNNMEEDIVEAYFLKGQCMLELMNYNEALQCFQKVIEICPLNSEVFILKLLEFSLKEEF